VSAISLRRGKGDRKGKKISGSLMHLKKASRDSTISKGVYPRLQEKRAVSEGGTSSLPTPVKEEPPLRMALFGAAQGRHLLIKRRGSRTLRGREKGAFGLVATN